MSGQKARRGSRRYPKSLQLAAVKEYLSGKKYQCEILKQFNIGDYKTLQTWVSKYEQDKNRLSIVDYSFNHSKMRKILSDPVPMNTKHTSFEVNRH